MKRLVLPLVTACMLVAVPAADGHTFWKSKAERISWRVAKALCDEDADCQEYSVGCSRRNQHRVDCTLRMHWEESDSDPTTGEETLTPVFCDYEVAWYYRGHSQPRNTKVRYRFLGSDCS